MAETKLSKHIWSKQSLCAVQVVSPVVALELGYLNSFQERQVGLIILIEI
jgi:hypothetical protein